MIRVRMPDGTVFECDTADDLEIVQRVLNKPQPQSRPAPIEVPRATTTAAEPTASSGGPISLNLRDPRVRKVFDVFVGTTNLDGEQLREKTGLSERELNLAMATFGTQIKALTGRPFDEFFLRRRVVKASSGQRVKVYVRTKAGEKLVRDLQGARNPATEALTKSA